jgi:flagellar protein FliO/FliZ
LPFWALLFLGAGLLFQISTISAQEEPLEVIQPPAEGISPTDRIQAHEQTQTLEEIQPTAEEPSPAQRILADEQTQTFDRSAPVPSGTAGGPSIWSLIRMILVLALSAAAVYGVVFLIKKASKQTGPKDPFLKILATTHLGSNRYAHIIGVGSKAWLLGSSDGGVNLISEIEDKDILNAMLLEESQKSAEAAAGRFIDFKSILRRLGVRTDSGAPDASNIRKRRDRLKGL